MSVRSAWKHVLAASFLLAPGCGEDSSTTAPPPGTGPPPPMVMSITAIDASHVRITFDSDVAEASAERTQNYVIVQTATPTPGPAAGVAADGDTLAVGTAVLTAGKEVLLTLFDAMSDTTYDASVSGVLNLAGEAMKPITRGYAGTSTPDVTPPTIAFNSPSAGAFGAGIYESVFVQFDEAMRSATIFPAVIWERESNDVAVPFKMSSGSPAEYVFTPLKPLAPGEQYSFALTSTPQDLAGNTLSGIFWLYTTSPTGDLVAPVFASSYPADGARNVPRDALLRLTFSERIDPASFSEEGLRIVLNPEPSDGVTFLQDNGATIRFKPDELLAANTQYTVMIPRGAVRDLAGNKIEETTTIRFTTGVSLAGGLLLGEVLGDPQSNTASSPQGTVVVASTNSPFADEDDGLEVNGTSEAGATGNYGVDQLPAGWYFPFGVKDSNFDGVLDPGTGDAFGLLGADISMGDLTIDSVQVEDDQTVAANFPLFDPHAIAGTVFYTGTQYATTLQDYQYHVLAFDTTAFDTTGGFPTPDFASDPNRLVTSPQYRLSEFSSGMAPGTYYVLGFLDVSFNGSFEPSEDPWGIFEVNGEWFPVTVTNGDDAINIHLLLADPPPGAFAGTVWRHEVAAPELRRLRALRDHAVRVLQSLDNQGR